MLAVIKEVFVDGYTIFVYPKPYQCQIWRIYSQNNMFVAGNSIEYNPKDKSLTKAEFQNCAECLSPFPWTDRFTVSD